MTSDDGIACMAKLLNNGDTKVTATPLPSDEPASTVPSS